MAHVLIFDSGVGGLSVAQELRKRLPDLHLSYIADATFRPYGAKSETALKTRLPVLANALMRMLQPDIFVLACNTASTAALFEIRAELEIPVVGVVPAIKPAATQSRSKTMAVFGTPGTVRRKYVDQLIADFAPGCRVLLHGSTRLVELAEDKLAGHVIDSAEIQAELGPLFAQLGADQIDTIVLACTHFPLLAEDLKKALPHGINLIDSGAAIARRVKTLLESARPGPGSSFPQTAFSIGGERHAARIYRNFGFKKYVVLPV